MRILQRRTKQWEPGRCYASVANVRRGIHASALDIGVPSRHVFFWVKTETKQLPTVADVVEQLKVPLDASRRSDIFAPAGEPPVLIQPVAGADKVEAVQVSPEVVVLRDAAGTLDTVTISWTIETNVRNLLSVDGRPFTATSITFSYSNITWQAGDGWPVYRVRCPNQDYRQNTYYQHAKFLALVHSIGGEYSIGCQESGVFTAREPGQVAVAVNDFPGRYGDNRGYFHICDYQLLVT